MATSKISFQVKLGDLLSPSDLDGLTQATKKGMSKELGEFIIDKILADTGNRRSSVTGQAWKGLSPEYKKQKSKIAAGVANLELHGDMLDALKARPKTEGVEVGVFTRAQALKADGHTHAGVFGQSNLPVRKFIPTGDETLRPGIMRELKQVARELYEDAPKKRGFDD